MSGDYLQIPAGMWKALDNGEPLSPREAALWMLGQVTFKQVRRHSFNGQEFELRRGEMVTTFTVLERAFRWPRSRVARFLGWLEGEGWLVKRVENGVTHITFCSDAIIRAGRNGADDRPERFAEQAAERNSARSSRCNIGRKRKTRNAPQNGERNANRNDSLPNRSPTKITPPTPNGVVPPEGGHDGSPPPRVPSAPEAKAKPKRKRRTPWPWAIEGPCPIPDDFRATAEAKVEGIHAQAEFEHWREWCLANGKVYADWGRAWNNRLMNGYPKVMADEQGNPLPRFKVYPGGRDRREPASWSAAFAAAGARRDG